jgi:hypothetical protein
LMKSNIIGMAIFNGTNLKHRPSGLCKDG